jgi:mRNA interferase HigB
MRVIKPSRLRGFWEAHARAKKSLETWFAVARKAAWRNLVELRATFGSADEVRVKSGKTVVVFNIAGNRYRLICAVHYNRRKIFVLRFMTHAEYDKEDWKQTL